MTARFLRRRWVVAAVATFGACVLVTVLPELFQPAPVERLRPYFGKDLRTLSEAEQIKVDGLLGRLAPEARMFSRPSRPQTLNPKDWYAYSRAKPSAPHCRSWYIWRVTNERLVLFQGVPLWTIPGGSAARTFVFDAKGRPLKHCLFDTGWRINIEDARWLEDSGHGFPCLLVCSRPSINGADVTAQYHALLEDGFGLVRLEDSAGQFVEGHPTIGPPVPERTLEEWESALRSSDQAEVLRSLVWLGGHAKLPIRDEQLRLEDVTRGSATRAQPGVRSAVEALTRSEDRWVREAAQHAWKAISDK
jgi:hypothetical protein